MSMPALPAPLLLPHVHPRFPLFPLHSPSCHLSVPPAPMLLPFTPLSFTWPCFV